MVILLALTVALENLCFYTLQHSWRAIESVLCMAAECAEAHSSVVGLLQSVSLGN